MGLDQAGDDDLAAAVLDRHAGRGLDVSGDRADAAVLDQDVGGGRHRDGRCAFASRSRVMLAKRASGVFEAYPRGFLS
jgi:hypothetical protein